MPKIPLTIQETMRALGVSDSSVRRMIKAGALKAHSREPGGRLFIDPESVEAVAKSLGREIRGYKADNSDEDTPGPISPVISEIGPAMASLAEVVNVLASTIQRQEDRIADLAMQLGEARAEVRLLPERTNQAERRAELLAQELEETKQALVSAQQQIVELQTRMNNSAYAPDQSLDQPHNSTPPKKKWWPFNHD